MRDLQRDTYEGCGVPPGEQRILWEGLPLPPEIKLSSVGNVATLMVRRRMHGRSGTLSGRKKKGTAISKGGKKKKRGTKKAAQRAAYHQDAKYRLELSYEERTAIMEGGRTQEEKPFKEFKESMEHTKPMHETQVKGLKVEQAYRKEIEAYKVPTAT